MTGNEHDRYDAFLSYSHSADRSLAAALQSAIESIGKPVYRRRASRVFRDQTSLPVSQALWGSIESALESSRFFILLASPESARSDWVRQEVAWWLRHRQQDQLFLALTAGELSWDAAKNRFADSSDAL